MEGRARDDVTSRVGILGDTGGRIGKRTADGRDVGWFLSSIRYSGESVINVLLVRRSRSWENATLSSWLVEIDQSIEVIESFVINECSRRDRPQESPCRDRYDDENHDDCNDEDVSYA